MDTQGLDQMLSVLRATVAQAAGKPAETQKATTDGSDFAQVLKNTIEQVNQTQQQAEDMAEKFPAGDAKPTRPGARFWCQPAIFPSRKWCRRATSWSLPITT